MDEVNEIEYLRSLVKERDRVRNEFTNSIATLIQPTALTAMFELFELEPTCVEWAALDIVEESLLAVVKVTYTSSENTSPFLKIMDVISKAAPTARARQLRIGIPLSLVFKSTNEIKEYLMATAQKAVTPTPIQPELPAATEFDVSALTNEQVEQLKLHQKMQKAGGKQ